MGPRRTLEFMNPGKLFDYLDGKLAPFERQELEERLMNEPQLRRELEMARQIHGSMRDSRRDHLEILTPGEQRPRGRRMGRQVLAAAAVLVAVNVAMGLFLIARHEAKNPNRVLLEKQAKDQLHEALEKAAGASLPTPNLGVAELKVSSAAGQAGRVAEQTAQIAQRSGGSATKGVLDAGKVQVWVDLPATELARFKQALVGVPGVQSVNGPESAVAEGRASLVVQIAENR